MKFEKVTWLLLQQKKMVAKVFLVWDKGFVSQQESQEEAEEKFSFMNSEVSREKPVDYQSIYDEFFFIVNMDILRGNWTSIGSLTW